MKLKSGVITCAVFFALSFQAQATALIQPLENQSLYQTLEHYYNSASSTGLPGATTESLGLYTGRCFSFHHPAIPRNAALLVEYVNFASTANGPIATLPVPELNYWHTSYYGASPALYDRRTPRRLRLVRAESRRNLAKVRLPHYSAATDSVNSFHFTLTYQHRQHGDYTISKVVDRLTQEPVLMCYYFR